MTTLKDVGQHSSESEIYESALETTVDQKWQQLFWIKEVPHERSLESCKKALSQRLAMHTALCTLAS